MAYHVRFQALHMGVGLVLVVGLTLAVGLGLLATGGTGQSRGGDRGAGPFVALREEGRRWCDGRCWDEHVLIHRRTGRRTGCCNAFPYPEATGLQLITAAAAGVVIAATTASGNICGWSGGLIAIQLQMVFITPPPTADIRCYGLHFGAIRGSIGMAIDLLVEGRYTVLGIQPDVVDAEYPQGLLLVLLLLLQLLLLLLLLMLLQVLLVRLPSLLRQLLLQ